MDTSKSSTKLLLKIVQDIADYQFGAGAGEVLFPEECRVEASKKTKRPRYVYLEDEILATIRYPDNLIALTLAGAKRMANALRGSIGKVVVKEDAVEKIKRGMNVTARDLLTSKGDIRPGDEVLVEREDGSLLAVGRASVASSTMRQLKRGIIVKIRRAYKDE